MNRFFLLISQFRAESPPRVKIVRKEDPDTPTGMHSLHNFLHVPGSRFFISFYQIWPESFWPQKKLFTRKKLAIESVLACIKLI